MSIIKILSLFLSVLPFLIILGIVVILVLCFKKKVRVKYKTFTKKGFRPVRGNFGVYDYCGKQGKGKTYSLVEYLIDNKEKNIVFCNIGGIKNIEYTHFIGFNGLLAIKNDLDHNTLTIPPNKQLVIVYDEIFTELQKGSKLDKEVIDFLCQMRKRKIIFLTTCQEWAELPLTFRRFCRYQIDCNMIPFLNTGLLIKTFHDAENMRWSNDDMDFIAPITETTITKCRKSIADSYDTFLRISSVESFSKNDGDWPSLRSFKGSSTQRSISSEKGGLLRHPPRGDAWRVTKM